MLVSIAIPCYRSSKTIGDVVASIKAEFNNKPDYEYEIILVNDGSPDNTFEVIYDICNKDERITGINLSKNFGQSAAKMAAIPYVSGDVLVFMDDDGQHPASGIFKLIDKLSEGYDMVYAYFPKKKHSFFKRITSNLHNHILYKIGSKPKDLHLSSFLAINKYAIDTLKNSGCPTIAVGAYLRRLTNKVVNIEIEHHSREQGKSGYSISKLFKLWKKSITSFNTFWLKLPFTLGIITGLAGIISSVFLIVKKILDPSIPIGYISLLPVILILSSVIMLLLGIVGEYIGKLFIMTSKLPPYSIRTVINQNKNEDNITSVNKELNHDKFN